MLDLSPEAQMQKNREEARKVFRAQFALQVIDNPELAKLAEGSQEPAAKADACRKRATEILLAFLNEE